MAGDPLANVAASVTTSAAQVMSGKRPTPRGFTVKAPAANTDLIAVGIVGVTINNGYVLSPGQSVTLYWRNPNLLYAVSASGTQDIRVVGGTVG